jgi:hypothetical protein
VTGIPLPELRERDRPIDWGERSSKINDLEHQIIGLDRRGCAELPATNYGGGTA